MKNDALLTLGLARRAGKTVPGMDLLTELSKAPALILVASDASERVLKTLKMRGWDFVRTGIPKADLGHALGCTEVAAVGVADAGFAAVIREKMKFQEEQE